MGKGKMKGFFSCFGKKQILCLLSGLILAFAAAFAAGREKGLSEDGRLERNGYGQGEAVYRLQVEGVSEKPVLLELPLMEQGYTKEEAYHTYERVIEQLPELILGENHSIDQIRHNLNLPTYLSDYGIRLKWESETPEILNSFGEIQGDELKNRKTGEEGENAVLRVRMTEGTWPMEHRVTLRILPPEQTDEERARESFLQYLKEEDRKQAYTPFLQLPREYEGKKLSYQLEKEGVFFPILGLGIVGAVLMGLRDKEQIHIEQERRKRQLALDYPEILSRLVIFLGAGMSIRTAWECIVQDYNRGKEKHSKKSRYAYEEMYEASCQMRGGMPEGKAYEEFGKRCGIPSYMKLAALLEQNRKNGSKRLRDTLRVEMAEAFEQRKHQARRLGEEAGTKLLLPLFLLLAVVMVMVALPALMEFK